MKIGAVIIVGAALIVAMLDYRLYSLPEEVRVLSHATVSASGADANVYLMVRNCGRYAQQTGSWWWKRTEVDYRACTNDPATAGEPRVIGDFKPVGGSAAHRIYFALACVSCKPGRALSAVTIWLGASPENGMATMRLPLDLRFNPEDELQLMYTPLTDTQVGLPVVE
jgi:hypothetical protein